MPTADQTTDNSLNTKIVQLPAIRQVPSQRADSKKLMAIPLADFLGVKRKRDRVGGYAPEGAPSVGLYINKASHPSPLHATDKINDEKSMMKKNFHQKISKDQKLFTADLSGMIQPLLSKADSNSPPGTTKKITLYDKEKIKQRKEDALKDFLQKEGFTPSDVAKVILPGKKNEKLYKAFKLTIQYNGDILRAMKDAGYTVSTQIAASRLIKSYSWHKLIDIYFPPFLLMEKGRELLDNTDWRARDSQLDRIHKLRGDFTKKVELKVSPSGDLSNSSNEELLKILEEDDNVIDQDDGTTQTS